jgi:hypothetical protein
MTPPEKWEMGLQLLSGGADDEFTSFACASFGSPVRKSELDCQSAFQQFLELSG